MKYTGKKGGRREKRRTECKRKEMYAGEQTLKLMSQIKNHRKSDIKEATVCVYGLTWLKRRPVSLAAADVRSEKRSSASC